MAIDFRSLRKKKRTNRVEILFTNPELEQLAIDCKNHELSLSDYVRAKLFSKVRCETCNTVINDTSDTE